LVNSHGKGRGGKNDSRNGSKMGKKEAKKAEARNKGKEKCLAQEGRKFLTPEDGTNRLSCNNVGKKIPLLSAW